MFGFLTMILHVNYIFLSTKGHLLMAEWENTAQVI